MGRVSTKLEMLLKLNKTACESFQMLTEAYGEKCQLQCRKGREDFEDDKQLGHLSTSKTVNGHPSILKTVGLHMASHSRLKESHKQICTDVLQLIQIFYKDINCEKKWISQFVQGPFII